MTEAIEVHIAGLRADGEPVPEEIGAPQLLTVTVAAEPRLPGTEAYSSALGGTRIPSLLIRR